jgi:demethylmenaquinone methyltransferase / 2-methoxy-6-polyprenyl-1,4-benzoquinol methylase
MQKPHEVAIELFAPLGTSYERWARTLSLGQDGRWRRQMVDGLAVEPGELALDVAAGTGSITRALVAAGASVVSLDQSAAMLTRAARRGAAAVRAGAERLPFEQNSFDLVTFGYLLRYVDDLPAAMTELARVLRPGGRLGMLEFGRPTGIWSGPWWLYTRVGLPVAGAIIGDGWREVGSFLGPNIDRFATEWPPERLAGEWRRAGLDDVRVARPSLGGGLLMWGRKR